MKPDLSILPAPDRSTEKRVPLTAKQRAQLALDQNGRCGCGCGERLDHAAPRTARRPPIQGGGVMGGRYTYTTCLSFGTDGEAGYCEIDVTVSFSVAWGAPETGRGYMADPYSYDPGSPDAVEDIRVESIDGNPPTNRLLAAMILDQIDGTTDIHTREMLAEAVAVEAGAAARAEDYRAEQMREGR